MKVLQKNKPSPSQVSEKFSLCKFYETDAYYSVGAVLHIVENLKDIPTSLLYDSIYDNMGFAIKMLFAYDICHGIMFSMKIMKMCKYISRICSAYRRLTNKRDLIWLEQLSIELNDMRKKNIIGDVVLKKISLLLTKMNIPTTNEEDIAVYFISFLLARIPKDPLI